MVRLFESIILWLLNRRAKLKDDFKANRYYSDREIRETVENLKIAGKIILRDRIKYLGKNYIYNNEIDMEDLSDLIEMHEIYHGKLGGNGGLDHLMTKVKKLPIKK